MSMETLWNPAGVGLTNFVFFNNARKKQLLYFTGKVFTVGPCFTKYTIGGKRGVPLFFNL
jgi:hypothetical protein